MYIIKSVYFSCVLQNQMSFHSLFSKNTFYLQVKVKQVSIHFLKEPNEWEGRLAEKTSSNSVTELQAWVWLYHWQCRWWIKTHQENNRTATAPLVKMFFCRKTSLFTLIQNCSIANLICIYIWIKSIKHLESYHDL